MALDLRANTAVDVLIGPFVDDSDGNTDETGLTLTQADIRLSKNAQNMAQKNDANAATHDELGYYNCPLDATDTNTEGTLVLCVHESGALPVRHEYNIMAEAAWDSLYSAKDSGYMQVDLVSINDTSTQIEYLMDKDTSIAADADLTSIVLDQSILSHLMTAGADTSDFQASTDSLEGVSVEAAKIPKSDGSVSWNATALAAIEAEALDALEGVQLDHLVGVTTGVAADGDLSTHCVDGSVMSHLLTAGADTSDYKASTDSLEGFRNHVGDGTNLTEVGDDGDHLTAINLPNQTMDITGDITGNLSGSVGSVTAVSDKTGYALSAAGNTAVIDEFETQSAADPTGFKVNVMEVEGADASDTIIGADGDTLETLSDQIDTAQTDLDELTDAGTLSGIRLALMLDRIYTRLFHEVNVTDADGSAAIRNSGDSADIATGSITDDDTTTSQAMWSWV